MKVVIDIPEIPTNDKQRWALTNGIPYPRGEWIPCKSTRIGQVTNIDYKCSECSHHKDRPVPYCEICGAIMKKKEGDEK